MSTSFSHWRKSSHSAPDGECVEVARSPKTRATSGRRSPRSGW
ncbi:DUF397 domain-containing protein [Actinomadura sp. BRA 177]|nr:DUF397 domain-containing protein [Actinomadura sp. BRA 177]